MIHLFRFHSQRSQFWLSNLLQTIFVWRYSLPLTLLAHHRLNTSCHCDWDVLRLRYRAQHSDAPSVCFSSFVFIWFLSSERIARKWYKLKMKEKKRRSEEGEDQERNRKWPEMTEWILSADNTKKADGSSRLLWLINRFQKSCNNFEICEFRNCY